MPEISHIKVTCKQCGAEYRVRLERIGKGEPLECFTCGYRISTAEFTDMLKWLQEYSRVVEILEKHFRIEGDTVIPYSKESIKSFFE